MKKIALICKKESKPNQEIAADLKKKLRADGYTIMGEADITKADLVLSLGGDGMILRSLRLLGGAKIPILGIYCGGLGFLTETTPGETVAALEKIANKKYTIDERTGIDITVRQKGKKPLKFWALNDFAMTKVGIARVINFDVMVGGSFLGHFKADGGVVSSATGSTAYNLSLNGPILSPEAPDLIFNPICSHSLAHRPVVTHAPIEIILKTTNQAAITLDGQTEIPIKNEDRVIAVSSKRKAYFIRLREYDLFETLRLKMGWG